MRFFFFFSTNVMGNNILLLPITTPVTAVQTPYFYFIHVCVANGCTNITPMVRFPKAIEVNLPKTPKKITDVMIV